MGFSPAGLIQRSVSCREIWNRCDVCGRFIPYADFESGKALHRMISPSSGLSMEEWETLCREHYRPSNDPSSATRQDGYCPHCGMMTSQCDCWDSVNGGN